MRSIRRALLPTFVLAAVVAFLPGKADAVVGGSTVAPGSNQFMAAVLESNGQICGGSVISARWVLTAAHCVPANPRNFEVAVGDVDWRRGRQITVDRIVVHPQYDADSSANDAALLHLASDAGVPALALAATGPAGDALEAHGATVTVAGWGSEVPIVGLVPPLGSRMKQADLTVVGDSQCSEDSDPSTQLCAEAFLADSCQGDSGGPLWSTATGSPVQVGVVSYGFGCATPTFPGVYSEVNSPSIRGWITRTASV